MPLDCLSAAQITQLREMEKISSMQDVIRALQRYIPFFKRARRTAARDISAAYSNYPDGSKPLPEEIRHWSFEDCQVANWFDIVERSILWERLRKLFLDELRAAGSIDAYASERTYRIAMIGMVLSEIVASNFLSRRSKMLKANIAISRAFRVILGKAPEGSKYSLTSLNRLPLEWLDFSLIDERRMIQHLSLLITAIEEAGTE